jgi:hypothetical protein
MIQELESTITIGARRPQKLDEGKKKKKRWREAVRESKEKASHAPNRDLKSPSDRLIDRSLHRSRVCLKASNFAHLIKKKKK